MSIISKLSRLLQEDGYLPAVVRSWAGNNTFACAFEHGKAVNFVAMAFDTGMDLLVAARAANCKESMHCVGLAVTSRPSYCNNDSQVFEDIGAVARQDAHA